MRSVNQNRSGGAIGRGAVSYTHLILIASTNASRPSKKRILTVCVKLFLEQGYKKTTVAQIVQQASVSNSIFQNIFRAKDGVLTELAQFMLSNQFAMARSTAGTQLPPIYVYAVETAIQMTLTELNENLREIYIEAYTQKEASDYIFRETAKELYQIFSPYQPELTEQDFYFMEIGSAGIMRGFMAHPCDEALTLEKKLRTFLTMSLRSYHCLLYTSRRSSSALAASRPCASSVRISRSPANTDSSPKRAASSSPRSITPPPSCATKPSARTPFQISRPSNPKSARSAQEPYNRQGTRRRARPSCFAARERPRLPLGKLAAEQTDEGRQQPRFASDYQNFVHIIHLK